MKSPEIKKFFSLRNLGFYFLLVILSLVAVWHFSEFTTIMNIIRHLRPQYFLLAILAQILTYWADAKVYQKLMLAFEIKPLLKLKEIFLCSIVSLFVNQVMPSAGASGSTFLLYYFHERLIKWRDALLMIILGLVSYYFALISILLIFTIYFTFSVSDKISGLFFTVIFIGLVIFIALATVLLFLSRREQMFNFFKKILGWRILAPLERRFQNFLADLRLSTEESDIISEDFLKEQWFKLLKPVGYQLLLFLFDTLTIYFLFLGLGLGVSIIYVALGLMATRIISLFSFIPGALIFFEGGMVFFFSLLGISAGLALVVTLLFRFLSFWLPMPVGLFLYKHLTSHTSQEPGGEAPSTFN